jgi:hypothetical protein
MKTHHTNAKTIPIKAREFLRVVMPKTSLEKLRRLESMGNKAARKAIFTFRRHKEDKKRLREKPSSKGV